MMTKDKYTKTRLARKKPIPIGKDVMVTFPDLPDGLIDLTEILRG
jgi:hypothetical protein